MKRYNPSEVEKKWQEYWKTNKTFSASENSQKDKKYVLVEFPYPSGDGLHMGHLRSYTAADVYSRYMRMQGKEVLLPMGWDAFGLPAENFAIKHGVQPAITTAKNIENIRKQCFRLGYSFDWDREINSTDPNYYKWTQWLFLEFYKTGLAYEATGLINWCPKDKTGLANEEVVGGVCERCGTEVQKKELRQWYLKITEYAEELLAGLENLPEWPDAVKLQQKNWIGKSEGAEIEFEVTGISEKIKVFTTRPDTIFGATYLVVSPEHSLLKTQSGKISNLEDVLGYVAEASAKAEIERTADGKEKTGIQLQGLTAINPATKKEIPIWVADYVLGNYGTGAIMAVPAHDERDFEFAKKFGLEIKNVIIPRDDFSGASYDAKTFNQKNFEASSAELENKRLNGEECYIGHGVLRNSGKFDNKSSDEASLEMAKKYGKVKTQYKLRDWVFSRQRYWGEPIPIVHCEKDGIVPVPEDQLPVVLPVVEKYEPTGTGESPLASIDEWVNTTCPKCDGPAKRETNTMPQWAGSSWYYLRYTDALNTKEFASMKNQKYWLPVDVYFGGMEHTTLHLLYSRFWNIFLHDRKLVPVSEPYAKRVPHGMILAQDGSKMSKSKGNVVNPDSIVLKFGADTTRMYELFLGPHESSVAWSDDGIVGVSRFLDKVWNWAQKSKIVEADSEEVQRALHNLIKKITEDITSFSYNTAVSSFMKFQNDVKDLPVSKNTIETFLKLLYPFAPHISEELSSILGFGEGSVQTSSWPIFDEQKLITDKIKFVVQVNGKVRDLLEVSASATQQEVEKLSLESEKVQAFTESKKVVKIIFVPNRLVNIVVAE